MDSSGNRAKGAPPSYLVVARVFHRLLALTFLVAWVSLGVQAQGLIGSDGLLPAAAFLDRLRGSGANAWLTYPTFLWWNASDTMIHGGILAGVLLALAAFSGILPRLSIAASTVLYLSYVTAARTFLSFQWDNLLLECGFLALFLSRSRSTAWPVFLFRVLLFKLYWESGVAKWQSPLHDWHDGSAMTFYYETAPLPTPLAWYAHHLPENWHRWESWLVLILELIVPFAIFGPRRLRLLALINLTAFQCINIATANYGFFSYLSLALHVFLLTDDDLARLGFCSRSTPILQPNRSLVRLLAASIVVATYLGVSGFEASLRFGLLPERMGQRSPIRTAYLSWRFINVYHLFGYITRERIEPEIQIKENDSWVAYPLRFKPGAIDAAPSFVAPHQPRLDFQLWFYGLSFRTNTPDYVVRLVYRLCERSTSVQSLFAQPLPAEPLEAVRIVFWQYHFTPVGDEGNWWRRKEVGSIREISCR